MTTPAKIIDQDLPKVALVGRVNVGKSTLFNRITETGKAIASPIPGTTRTRNISLADWRGKNFILIDTGGLTFSDKVVLEKEIIEQTEKALKECDLLVFVADVQTGLLPQEKELVQKLLKKTKKPTIFVANKADSPTWLTVVYDKEWLKLGLGTPQPVSAQNGSGVGDLLDEIFKKLNKTTKKPKTLKDQEIIKVSIIGKPNVGKSSLFNSLIGEDRVIVSDMPHTTREPHDTLVELENKNILFVDTAGIRRKTKVSGSLERIGITKSLDMISRSDIVLLVLDATEPITDQDQQLAGLLQRHNRSVIFIINKWDLSEDNSDKFRNEIKEKIYAYFPHLSYAPIVLVSAKTQYRVHQIFPMIFQAYEERQTVVPEEDLKVFIKNMVRRHLPSRDRGVRHPEVLGLTQIAYNPPIFEMQVKAKTSINMSYVHFVANQLRQKFSFYACPVVIKLSKIKKMAPRAKKK